MPLRLILGRAGTGKTQYCLERIRAELRAAPLGPELIFLVPDQATFQMERALLATPDLAGFARAQVLSFSRLARRVVGQTGGTARPQLGELGRRMLLRAVLGQLEGELELFGQSWRQPGFLEHLQRTLGELRAYAHTSAELHELNERLARAPSAATARTPAASQASPDFLAKLRDLERIFRAYSARLEKGFVSPDQLMDWAAQRLLVSSLWPGCRVWVDGFTGFTPQELRLLAALMRQAQQTEITLCLDSRQRELDQNDTLFAPTQRTAAQLLRLADQLRIPLGPALLLDPTTGPPARFAQSPALAAVERFWSGAAPAGGGDRQTASTVTAGSSLVWVEAANRHLEVEAAAQQIRRLASERGWRWRDMAVLTWSLSPYQALLENVLARWGIPYFLDVRRPLLHHPAVELVRSALAVVSGGWQTVDVLQYVKTDLAGVTRDEQDRLEEWAFQYGVDGEKGWLTAGHARANSPLAAEVTRALMPLRRLAGRLQTATTTPRPASHFALAVYQFWEDLQLAAQLQRWLERERQAGRLLAAEADRQVWQQLVALLDELVNGLGDQPLTLSEFRQVVESGLSGLSLGLVPPSLDQVVVGTVERSRLPAVRAVLLLGAVAGEFPAVPEEDTLLADSERERLAQVGLELADAARRRLLHQPYSVYVATTRASELLWASYPQSDGAGRTLLPAAWWTALRQQFSLQPQVVRDEDDIWPVTLGALAGRWARWRPAGQTSRAAGPADDPSAGAGQGHSLYRLIASDPVGRSILTAPHQSGEVPLLTPATVTALYGERPPLTVSQLETVAACPFQQLAAFGWRLREWETPQVEAAAFGQAVHRGLEWWVQEVQRALVARPADSRPSPPDWAQLTGGLADEVLAQVLQRLRTQLERELPASGQRHYQEQVIARVLKASLPALCAQISESSFRPWRVEYAFDVAWPLADGRQVRLRGRIDRIDVARDAAGRWYARVIDYKSGTPERWQADQLGWGLAVQLVVYLAVACGLVAADKQLPAAQVIPAGAFYFPVAELRLRARAATLAHLSANEIGRKRQGLWRLHGPVVGVSPVRELLDRCYAAGQTGPSQLVPIAVNKDGELARTQSLQLDLDGMRQLLAAGRRQVGELAGQILSGQVTPHPFRQIGRGAGGGRTAPTACQRCLYAAICGFDPQLPAHRYRDLYRT